MKFLHIADIHLGASPDAGRAYSESRPNEIWDSLSEVIEICREEQIDILLVAGDLFHRQPLLRELKEVNHLFASISPTRVVIIAGNHDYIKPSSYYRTFQWTDNVYPLFQEEMGWVEFPELKACVYGFSYFSREIKEARYDSAASQGRQPFEILLGHGGDEKHIPVKRQKLAALGYSYVALGHIHKPQELEQNHIHYSGALEPLDKNDTGPHGYVFGEINERGVKAVFIPAARRSYLHIQIEVGKDIAGYALKEEIQKQIKDRGTENIYKIVLTGLRDPDVEFDLEGMDVLGNIIEITDNTEPAYDFDRLEAQNKDNLLGKYIRRLSGYEEGSIENQALYQGVQAILETRRG